MVTLYSAEVFLPPWNIYFLIKKKPFKSIPHPEIFLIPRLLHSLCKRNSKFHLPYVAHFPRVTMQPEATYRALAPKLPRRTKVLLTIPKIQPPSRANPPSPRALKVLESRASSSRPSGQCPRDNIIIVAECLRCDERRVNRADDTGGHYRPRDEFQKRNWTARCEFAAWRARESGRAIKLIATQNSSADPRACRHGFLEIPAGIICAFHWTNLGNKGPHGAAWLPGYAVGSFNWKDLERFAYIQLFWLVVRSY